MSWERIRQRLHQTEARRERYLLRIILLLWLGGWIALALFPPTEQPPEMPLTETEAWETLASFWPIDL